MGGMISIAMSYIMWKEYNTIIKASFKNKRDAWVESHKMLDERALMEKEDKINNIIIL
jgi:hypothetical protein